VTALLVQEDINSDVLHSDAPRNDATDSEVQQLENRVADLEQRVSSLEYQPVPVEPDPRDTTPTLETATDDSHTDLLEYVREHGPVKAGELKEHCYPEDHHLARSTWWTKRAKERLKESGASYRNNQGWRFE